MVKFLLRTLLLSLIALTLVVSSLSAFKPKELYRDQVAVLMFHHIHDKDESSSTITTKLFRDQLTYLQNRGFHFISLNDFKQFLQGSPVPENAVLVTFDDGYESFHTNAYPILKELHVPAVNFLITDTFKDPKQGGLPFLSREEVRTMAKESGDLIAFGSHTDALHAKVDNKALLTGKLIVNGKEETDQEYSRRILEDTRASISKINELVPYQTDTMAYPFGIYNEKAIQLVKEAGIKYGFTILPRMATRKDDPLRIPRINAGSPYITPEVLYNTIARRVTVVSHPNDNVLLRETVEQIGGSLGTDKTDGGVIIYYNGQQIKISQNRREAIRGGTIIPLSKPVKISGSRMYINLNDLENILGIPIYLDPATQTFTSKPPARSEFDMDVVK